MNAAFEGRFGLKMGIGELEGCLWSSVFLSMGNFFIWNVMLKEYFWGTSMIDIYDNDRWTKVYTISQPSCMDWERLPAPC